METHLLSSKENFQAQQLVKKVLQTVFWNMKRSITINFLEKGATVHSTSYCQLLSQYSSYSLDESHMSYISLIMIILNGTWLNKSQSNI